MDAFLRSEVLEVTSGARSSESKVVIRPVTPDRWDDVVALFGPRGACAGCWCMYFRQSRSEFERKRRLESAGAAAADRWRCRARAAGLRRRCAGGLDGAGAAGGIPAAEPLPNPAAGR